jgi:spermidine synthase
MGNAAFYRLVTNGFSMSGTNVGSQRYMKAFVHLPVAIHENIRSALLVSYGVGSTASALTSTRSIETIDIVDISRDILDMSRIVYPRASDNPLNDPRVTVHVEDGRFFLSNSTRQFDLSQPNHRRPRWRE